MPQNLPSGYFNLEYLYYQIYTLLKGLGIFTVVGGQLQFTGGAYIFYAKLVLIFLSVIFILTIIDLFYRLMNLRREEEADMLEAVYKNLPADEKENVSWVKVTGNVSSENESDWRLAIIEADKMLDALMSIAGFSGASLGEKLLAVEPGEMLSLNDAWEAHKYRNKIAHEPGFVVSHYEAKRVIGLYEKVFREYEYI